MEDVKIYVIGAGISGLVAAKTLSENGYHPVIIEATGGPGGRVKTDREGGSTFDHGFQVLLTGYPNAQKHLDYTELNLRRFKPGAMIFENGKSCRIGDPLRDFSSLLPTLKAPVGSWSDKWKIFRLSSQLKKKSIEEIFESEEKTTLQYLKDFGFSDAIIRQFFRPFFTGIFLEDELRTSSRMFEFTFKMFSEGEAAIPAMGIGDIALQLASQAKKCSFRYMESVAQITEDHLVLEHGDPLPYDGIISTIPLDPQSGKPDHGQVHWKRCDNLYFTTKSQGIPHGIIGLIADDAALVNNLYYNFSQCKSGAWLLSVTVVGDHGLDAAILEKRVREELQQHCGIEAIDLVRHYPIEKALPDLENLQNHWNANHNRILERVFTAGDFRVNGSLNAAMASGEEAALALMQQLG